MYRQLAVAVICVQLVGCAMSKEVYLPDGSKGYRISCDGMVLSAGDCLEKAGAICGTRGFTVVDERGEAVPFSTASASSGVMQAQAGMVVTRSLFMRCKE